MAWTRKIVTSIPRARDRLAPGRGSKWVTAELFPAWGRGWRDQVNGTSLAARPRPEIAWLTGAAKSRRRCSVRTIRTLCAILLALAAASHATASTRHYYVQAED